MFLSFGFLGGGVGGWGGAPRSCVLFVSPSKAGCKLPHALKDLNLAQSISRILQAQDLMTCTMDLSVCKCVCVLILCF